MIFKSISELNESQKIQFYSLAAEYLSGNSQFKMKEREVEFSKAYIAVLEKTGSENSIIGICYGWPRKLDAPEENTFTLDGITVTEKFQKKGIGSVLLEKFCQAAKAYGYNEVSVGSADGYVEKYYLKNGFIPSEYKIWQMDKCVKIKDFSSIKDYEKFKRPKDQEGFVVFNKKI